MSLVNFRVAVHAEIKQSNWLKKVMVLGRTNQGALFQRSSIATLLLNLEPWSSGYG